MLKIKEFIKNNEKTINNLKTKWSKNKKKIYIGLGCVGALAFPISIYFTQTAFFYNMEKIEKNEFKNFDTIYAYNSSISSKYRRTIPWTYRTNIPLEKYAWYDNPWYKANYNNDALMQSARKDLVDEAKWMMDVQYLKDQVAKRKLKKHPAADYQYGYDRRIPNSAPAVVKNFNVDLNRSGTLTTGLYIPPGEIVKINFKDLTAEQLKKINVSLIIADNEFDNYPDGKITKKDTWFNRMPILRTQVSIDTPYFEFGTPFGGIVNLQFNGTTLGDINNVGVSIKGAIEALHYVHGHTTEEEWYRLVKEAKAPIAEIANDYVSFIGPKHKLSNFRRVNDKTPPPNPLDPKYYPYKAMKLMNNLAMDGHYTIDRLKNKLPKIRFLTTTYVSTGAAYAAPGGWRVVQPWHWIDYILDYDWFLNNGIWGIMHEMNHHNQDWFEGNSNKWGFTAWGESSNNAITLSSYIKYTNVLSKRDGLEKQGEKGISHEQKLNGYIAQKYTNNAYSGKTARGGFDTDYSLPMANFGPEAFQESVRSYKNSNIKTPFNTLVENLPNSNPDTTTTPPEPADKYQNAKFIDRISQVTGYNFSQYYLDTGLITQEMATKINDHLSALSSKIESNNTNKFKPYAPLFSFYASDVKYDSSSPTSIYKKVQAPFFIDKKYFDTGYNFKLEELLETSRKITGNSPNKVVEDYYTISNVKLVSQPKYGTMTENTSSTGKKEYNYKPNLKNINDIDEFEYSADVERKATTPPSGSKDLLQGKNQKITVNFKVKIKLDGNQTEFEVPNILNNQQYKNNYSISSHDMLQDIVMENPLVNGKPVHKYWANNTTEKNLLNANSPYDFQVRKENDIENVVLNLTLKDFVSMNFFTLYNKLDEGHVSGFKIEDLTNDTPKTVFEGPFIGETTAIYRFPMIKTNKLRITFLKSINGSAPQPNWIKLGKIDFGMFSDAQKIVPANSNLIQTFGDWRKGFGGSKYNKDSLFSINPFTSIYFGIRNVDALSILGAKDKNYGSFDIYIDGKFYKTINTNKNYRTENTPLEIISDIKANFSDNDHIIKITSKSIKPIEIQGFNLDGQGEMFLTNEKDSYYILVTVIPIVSIFLIVTSIVVALILISKKRKVKK